MLVCHDVQHVCCIRHIIGLEVHDGEVGVVTHEAGALAVGPVEVAPVVDGEAIGEVGSLCVGPRSHSAELVGAGCADIHFCNAILCDAVHVALADETCRAGIVQGLGARDADVGPAVANDAAAVVGDTGSVLPCGGDAALYFQPLDDGESADGAEQCRTLIVFRAVRPVEGNGMACAVEDTAVFSIVNLVGVDVGAVRMALALLWPPFTSAANSA